MKKLIIILFVASVIVFESCAQESISEQSYEVEVLTKNGLFCNFYFQYSMSDQLYQTNRDQIQIKLDEELLKIANKSTLTDLVNATDSIGPSIENKIKNKFALINLKVTEVRVDAHLKDYLIKKRINVDRVEINTGSERKNYAGSTKRRLEVKSHSGDLSMVLKTKENSEVRIKYVISFSNTLKKPFDSLNPAIENTIVDSLRKYKMYEMWTSHRDSLGIIMESIIRASKPETYSVLVREVMLPEEAETHFLENEKLDYDTNIALIEIYQNKILLTNKLKKNKDLSESEIIEIEKGIEVLENKEATHLKKLKLLNYDYKPEKL